LRHGIQSLSHDRGDDNKCRKTTSDRIPSSIPQEKFTVVPIVITPIIAIEIEMMRNAAAAGLGNGMELNDRDRLLLHNCAGDRRWEISYNAQNCGRVNQ
jgi:chloramphenicol 3-O-phosphotransferase